MRAGRVFVRDSINKRWRCAYFRDEETPAKEEERNGHIENGRIREEEDTIVGEIQCAKHAMIGGV